MGMTGLMSVNREDRSTGELKISGLIRDMKPVGTGGRIGCVNWQDANFVVVDLETLTIRRRINLAPSELFTPWNFAVDGKKVYITNVTHPILAEFSLQGEGDDIDLSLQRKINFYETGYTKSTDGAFGLYLHPNQRSAYVLVGMMEGRYRVGLVEVDLESFRITREVRLPAGITLIPVEGTNNVLLPSYYYDAIYEVSLTTMEVVRRIEAEASIFSMEFDSARGLLYATSRTAGLLLVLDYETGKILHSVYVGNKPEPLLFDRDRDELYIGSMLGILRIQLGAFLGSG